VISPVLQDVAEQLAIEQVRAARDERYPANAQCAVGLLCELVACIAVVVASTM
jgi:hypothetical protein